MLWPLAGALLLAACWPRRLAWRLPIALAAVAALPLLVKPPAWVCEQYVQWYRYLVGPAQIRHTYRDAWTIWELISAPVNPRLYARAAIGDGGRGAGPLPVASAPITPTTKGSFRARVLDLVAACLRAGNRAEHVCLDCPPDELGPGRRHLGETGMLWLMGLSFLLTILAAMGGVEDLYPWLKALHPVGVLLFFAWFFAWNSGLVVRSGYHVSMVGEDCAGRAA